MVIDTFLSVKTALNPKNRKYCFEIFGYDFFIDEDFRVWLIECNTNPYLGEPNEYIREVLPQMADDLLQIVLDPIFPPSYKYQRDSIYLYLLINFITIIKNINIKITIRG